MCPLPPTRPPQHASKLESQAGGVIVLPAAWILQLGSRDKEESKRSGGSRMDNLCEDFTLHEKHITSAGIHLHMTHWSKPFQDSHRLVYAALAGRDLFCSPFPSESAPPTGDIGNMLMGHLRDLHTSYMVHVFMLLNFNMLRLPQMSSEKWGVCRHRRCYITLNTTACRSPSQLR